MSERTLDEFDGDIKNAIIQSAQLDIGDRGFLQGWLMLDYGGTCQGFGGWMLCRPSNSNEFGLAGNYGGVWLTRVMEVAGVGEWSALVGKTIRAKSSHSKVHAIGHIVKDDWFAPAIDFARIEKEMAQ